MKCEKMRKLFDEGYEEEKEILNALLAVVEESPEDSKLEARAILCAAFPSHPEGCDKMNSKEVEKDG